MLIRKNIRFAAVILLAGFAVSVAGCATSSEPTTSAAQSVNSVTVETANGPVAVPVEPKRVVALDNTSFETLRDWGITPVAVPKGLLPGEGFEDWVTDENILDIGTHREPQLELVSEAQPDLILGGYRFSEYQDDLSSIGLTIDIAASEDYSGGWIESLKAQTETLGTIFNKESEADKTVRALEDAEKDASAATGDQTVFFAVVSGGKIDNGSQRIGRIIEPLTLQDVFAGEGGDIHGDSGLAPETIAQANPDWVIVLDRDAAVGESGVLPAEQVFAAQEALRNTTFMTEDHIIYLDPYFYTREGIQAYTQVYQQITDAFNNS
ncbi:ABC transporter substrate-binding protein [Lysinibacter sp. HNR]|uniref:siderophore ABC transporter substrate-binding protein n=1 Tax=Lysinibacter sp. HNR TaxID=3031408 RepID=UPI002434D25D|nr:ABC transporter substrate-binding protein [Lysinibacter sp. HNR]WGD36716.1 ABC transporter substrate-binding protein [Lysinibacter sp. HNR]